METRLMRDGDSTDEGWRLDWWRMEIRLMTDGDSTDDIYVLILYIYNNNL